jgi:hypothetical protein
MQKNSLFQINSELVEVTNLLIENGGELTPELESRLQIAENELKAKSVNYYHVIKELESTTNMIDAEIKRLQELKKARVNTIEKLENALLYSMKLHGIEKIDTDTLKISLRRSKSVEVVDIDLLPFNCLKIEKKAIKSEIKKLIEEGMEIDGAKIVENTSIQFK